MPRTLELRLAAPLLLTALSSAAHAPWGPPATGFGVVARAGIHGSVENVAGGPKEYFNPGRYESDASISGYYQGSNYQLNSWSASKGSLAAGTIGARSGASCTGPYGTAGDLVGASASATMWETVTLKAGSSTNLGLIPLQLQLDGSTTGNVSGVGGSYAIATMKVYDLDQQKYLVDYNSGITREGVTLDTALGPNDDMLEPLIERHFVIHYSILAYSNIGYRARHDATTTADYMNTLHFRWNLPAGVTYTTESGVWAPPAIQAVPEPATLGVLGVGVLALLRRRKR